MSSSTRDQPRATTEQSGRVIDLRVQRIRHIDVETAISSRGVPDYSGFQGAAALAVEQAQIGELILVSNSPYVGATSSQVTAALVNRGLKPGVDIFVAAQSGDASFTAIGGSTRECTRRAMALLGEGQTSPAPVGSPEIAEMLGMAAAVLSATREAAEWEIGRLCAALRVPAAEILPLLDLFPKSPGLAAALSWQARAIVSTPVIEAAAAARRNRSRELLQQIREALAEAGKSLAWSRILIVGASDEELVTEIGELARHSGAEVLAIELPLRPVECDLVLNLCDDEPLLAPGSMPIRLDANGLLRRDCDL